MSYSSDDDDDEPLVFRWTLKPDKAKGSSQPSKPSPKPNNDSGSEDDKPLSFIRSNVSERNANHAKNGSHMSVSTAPKPQAKYEDSDDEKPLSFKFISKSNVGSASKVHQNDSVSRGNQPKNISLNKRPLGEERSSGQSSVKKPKLLDSSTPVNRKPVTLKAETKSDDDDKPLVFRRILKPDKAKGSFQPPKPNNDSDSEDDKPLTSKLSNVYKGNTNHAKNGSYMSVSTAPKPQAKCEDSDDEKPLSLKFISKPNVGSTSKVHQNGSAVRDNQPKNIGVNKRPLGEERSYGQSSVKKPKLLDSSTPVNRKPVTLKAEARR